MPHHPMPYRAGLPRRFAILIEGKRWNVTRRANIVPNELPHLIARLLTGELMDLSVFEAHGLRVMVEECTDQGDDFPDTL